MPLANMQCNYICTHNELLLCCVLKWAPTQLITAISNKKKKQNKEILFFVNKRIFIIYFRERIK